MKKYIPFLFMAVSCLLIAISSALFLEQPYSTIVSLILGGAVGVVGNLMNREINKKK